MEIMAMMKEDYLVVCRDTCKNRLKGEDAIDCLRYTKREPVPPLLLTRFGGQPPNGCESNLGASSTDAHEKGSHVALISAIVTVSSPPTLAIGELEMITVEEREAIRRAYYLEGKSKRQIAREHSHSRKTVDKAVDNQPPRPYRLSRAKPSPVFGAFRARADELLAENAHLPPKQQYTGHKIYELLQAEGYQAVRRGSACT